MFGGGSSASVSKSESSSTASDSAATNSNNHKERPASKSPSSKSPARSPPADASIGSGNNSATPTPIKTTDLPASDEKRGGNGSSPPTAGSSAEQKKRRSSGVSGKASSLLATARNTLNFSQVGGRSNSDLGSGSSSANQTPLQKLGKQDPALAVPQGQHNNSAGESLPGPKSTFKVGVWEDRNKKCRKTMEDTHAFLYNFLRTPAPVLGSEGSNQRSRSTDEGGESIGGTPAPDVIETDNGYFAIFDGHAGTFAADWCGKKLHIILEDIIRKNPNLPMPEVLDQTFTSVDAQLEKLPLKNSGCTAAIAVLRWEDRVPSTQSYTGSQAIAPAVAAAAKSGGDEAVSRPEDTMAKASLKSEDGKVSEPTPSRATLDATVHARLKSTASRQRVLYTANVGDARIILCRNGKGLRLSYDHKGSDELEGKRIANAGGLILNNRVNGVLAVTRALGDTYMKDLVTGHPYTTETVVQPEVDEFMIIACDGLWDVCSDQEAVDLVREIQDPVKAAKLLVDHALARFSTDNLSCMIVRFDKVAVAETQGSKENAIGVEGDESSASGKVSEAERIVGATKQKIAEGETPAVGVSASNSGRGHDPIPLDQGEAAGAFKPTAIEGSVEEEPSTPDEDSPEATPDAPAVAAAIKAEARSPSPAKES